MCLKLPATDDLRLTIQNRTSCCNRNNCQRNKKLQDRNKLFSFYGTEFGRGDPFFFGLMSSRMPRDARAREKRNPAWISENAQVIYRVSIQFEAAMQQCWSRREYGEFGGSGCPWRGREAAESQRFGAAVRVVAAVWGPATGSETAAAASI